MSIKDIESKMVCARDQQKQKEIDEKIRNDELKRSFEQRKKEYMRKSIQLLIDIEPIFNNYANSLSKIIDKEMYKGNNLDKICDQLKRLENPSLLDKLFGKKPDTSEIDIFGPRLNVTLDARPLSGCGNSIHFGYCPHDMNDFNKIQFKAMLHSYGNEWSRAPSKGKIIVLVRSELNIDEWDIDETTKWLDIQFTAYYEALAKDAWVKENYLTSLPSNT